MIHHEITKDEIGKELVVLAESIKSKVEEEKDKSPKRKDRDDENEGIQLKRHEVVLDSTSLVSVTAHFCFLHLNRHLLA
jgi:hypothetical protein